MRRTLAFSVEKMGDDDLHQVNQHLSQIADSLRSSVAKNALITLFEMFDLLGKRMDPNLDVFCPVLLKKASDTNAFINTEGKAALYAMCENCTESKIMKALGTFFKSKNA